MARLAQEQTPFGSTSGTWDASIGQESTTTVHLKDKTHEFDAGPFPAKTSLVCPGRACRMAVDWAGRPRASIAALGAKMVRCGDASGRLVPCANGPSQTLS